MKKYLLTLAVISMAAVPAYAGDGDRATSIASSTSISASSSEAGARAVAGGGGGGSATNNTSFRVPRQAPGIGAPGLAASANACLGSISGGASAAGFGASFGVTYLERNCEARAVSELLARYGQRSAAIRLLINEHPMVRRAYAHRLSGR